MRPPGAGWGGKRGYSDRQLALAMIWVENKIMGTRLSFKEMVAKAGYPMTTASINAKRTIVKEGTQKAIKMIETTMKEALEEKGVTPEYLAGRLQLMLEGKIPKNINWKAVNMGLDHTLKIGIGGGYKPEERRELRVDVSVSAEDLRKYKPLKDEYEERIRQAELAEEETDG